MKLLILGIALATVLLLITIPIVVRHLTKRSDNTLDLLRLKQHGKQVIALVTDIKSQQGWKYENGSQWNSWEGRYQQARAWRTYYDITALWIEPQTKQSYTFSFKLWADEVVSTPNTNSIVPVVFDP